MKWLFWKRQSPLPAPRPLSVTTYEAVRNLDVVIRLLSDDLTQACTAQRAEGLLSATRWLRKLQTFLKEIDMGQLAQNWSAVKAELTTLKATRDQQAQQIAALQSQLSTAQALTLDAADQAVASEIAAEANSVSSAQQQPQGT